MMIDVIFQGLCAELEKTAGMLGNALNAYHGAAQRIPGMKMPALPAMRQNFAQGLRADRNAGFRGAASADRSMQAASLNRKAQAINASPNPTRMTGYGL